MTPRFKRIFIYIRIAVYVIVPAILILLPVDFFDRGRAICLSVVLAGMECYACGMTRACMNIIHFDFVEAYYYNPLAFVAFPLLALLWLRWFLRDVKQVRRMHRKKA
jgi:hypothetical protein